MLLEVVLGVEVEAVLVLLASAVVDGEAAAEAVGVPAVVVGGCVRG